MKPPSGAEIPVSSVSHQQSKSQAFPRRASAKGRDVDIKSSLPSLVFTALLYTPRELWPTKDRAGTLVWLSHALPRPGCISSAVVICGWTSSGRPGKPPEVFDCTSLRITASSEAGFHVGRLFRTSCKPHHPYHGARYAWPGCLQL